MSDMGWVSGTCLIHCRKGGKSHAEREGSTRLMNSQVNLMRPAAAGGARSETGSGHASALSDARQHGKVFPFIAAWQGHRSRSAHSPSAILRYYRGEPPQTRVERQAVGQA